MYFKVILHALNLIIRMRKYLNVKECKFDKTFGICINH